MAVMTAEWLVVIMVALWVGKMVAILVGVMAEKMAE